MQSVCIIGAGPAGLGLALCLQKRGLARVTLVEARGDHERERTYDPARSYTIDLTGHGMRALDYVGARARLEADLIPFRGLRITVAVPHDSPHAESGVTGSRGDICRALLRELRARELGEMEILFDTEAVLLDAESGRVRIGDAERQFDLVVGADGAGSLVRAAAGVSFSSGQYTNHSSMIQLDRDVDELDPSWLYVFGAPPVMIVAGAINGPRGREDPLWFCQVGTDGPIELGSVAAARAYLETHCRKILPYLSEASIERFAGTKAQPTGRWKVLSHFVRGRCVLVGDAAAPFPPIGQGINAALECVTVLDRAIGDAPQDLLGAARRYEAAWMPEARAATELAKKLDLRISPLQITKALIYSQLGVSGVQNAKKSSMSYAQALARERWADRALASIVLLGATGLVWSLLR